MLLNQLISNIQELWNSGPASDNTRLSDRLIYSQILEVKSELVYRKYTKQRIDTFFKYRTIYCVELVDTSVFDCPCVPVKGCLIKRSKFKIPKIISDKTSGDMIEGVRSIDGKIKFNRSSLRQQQFKNDLPYGLGMVADYWIENDYLYITYTEDTENLMYVRLRALFYDDVAAEEFAISNCGATTDVDPCSSAHDVEIFIDVELTNLLESMIIEKLYKYFNVRPQDIDNNSIDDTIKKREFGGGGE